MAVWTDLAKNSAQLRLEAEAQHAVGFVQHEVSDASQGQRLPLQQIQQPTAGGNHNLASGGQRLLLRVALHAAQGGHHAHLGAARETGAFGVDLVGQLASRRKDQSYGTFAFANWRLVSDVHKHGKNESERFAWKRRGKKVKNLHEAQARAKSNQFALLLH